MVLKKLVSTIFFMVLMSSNAFSGACQSTSEASEWATLCEQSEGNIRETCEILKKEYHPNARNWSSVYKEIKRAHYYTGRMILTSKGITDLTPIADFTFVTCLELSLNNISDLRPLARMVNLSSLYLQNNNISDIRPLMDLDHLDILDLGANNISPEDFIKLQKRLKRTVITNAAANLKNIF